MELIDHLLSAPNSPAHLGTEETDPRLSITGGDNSPPTPAGSNDPGLESATPKTSKFRKIVPILLVLLIIFALLKFARK